MKKTMRIFSIVLMVLMLCSACINVFAATVSIENMINSGTMDQNSVTALETFGGTLIKYITNAAMIISVVMIAALGIKYMMGSAEEKGEYKKSLIPLLIGAILVFGAATVAKIIVGLAGSFGG